MNQTRWFVVAALSVLAGCFSPEFQEGAIACGPNGECPPEFSCAADNVCRKSSKPMPDARVDAKIDGMTIDADTTAPNVPTLTLVTPTPANNNTPQLTGTTEAGTTVAIYIDGTCTTPVVGFDSVSASSLTAGILVPVPGDATTIFKARAKDAAGNPSACTSGVTFVEDSTPPALPTLTDTIPLSPSRSTMPTVRGTTEPGATATVFTDATCTTMAGAPMIADGSGAFAIPVTIAAASSTTFYATSRDVAMNVSGCSTSTVQYNQDSSAVSPPTFTSSTPASPSKNSTNPTINGTTEASVTVKLYTDSSCNGAVAATGTSDASGNFAIPVTVSANSTTTFYGQSQDMVAGVLSICSQSSLRYVHDTIVPAAPMIVGSTPSTPSSSTAPSITGTTEAFAHVDLYTAAGCTGAIAGSGDATMAGTFSIAVAITGTTQFYGIATDLAGNVSTCSSSFTYTFDNTPPNTPTINATIPASPSTTNNTPAIIGNAETNATVKIYLTADCSGTEVASGVASGGAYGIGITVPTNATSMITAKAFDPAGNASGCSTPVSYLHDSLVPDSPVFTGATPSSPSSSNTPSVSGTAEANTTIQLYTNATCTTLLGSSFSSGGGTFSTMLTVADNSSTTIYATATDGASNKSPCSAPFTYVEDSAAPATPTLTQLPPSQTNTTPNMTGNAEANTTVSLYANGTCSGGAMATGTATGAGTFSIGVTVTANTTTTFSVRATDAAMNQSACSTAVTYTHDNITPGAPSGLDTTPSSPAGTTSPMVTGSAEAGATVRLFTNPTCSSAVAGTATAVAGNTFSVNVSVAGGSTTTYYATATDPAGNASGCSASFVTYTQDNVAPPAPSALATSPVSPSSNNTPNVTGNAESGSTVSLYTNATCTGAAAFTGTAGGANTFTIPITVGANSSTTFYATATDAASNTSACSTSSVTYIEDSTNPGTPTIAATNPVSPANNNGPALTGTAEANATVKIFTNASCSGAATATGTADGAGAFSIVVNPSDNSMTTYYASATDGAGNTSGCSTGKLYTEDSLAPATPSNLDTNPASPVNNTSPSITGNAESGSTVGIYTSATCSGAPVGTGTASGGTFSIVVNVPANATSTFYAKSTDAAGNASSCSSSVVYIEDSSTPGLPTLTSSSPGSPSSSASPTVNGTAEAGSTVKLYATAMCTGAPLASGTATGGGTFAIVTPVTANATTTLRATATDAANNVSGCSTSSLAFTNDSIAPGRPTALATTPAGPANNNAPTVTGMSEAGALVTLYTNSACTVSAGASGTAAADGTFSIGAAVGDNTVRTFYATATDAAGNISPCSTMFASYTEDSANPAAPSGLATTPTSPSSANSVGVSGTAEAGSTVKIYSNAGCTTLVATGPAATFATGISVSVANDSTTTFYATATDAANNVSSCSSGVTYVEDSTAPTTPVFTSTNPTSPANDTSPIIVGTAEAGATVKLYTMAACAGSVVAQGAAGGGNFSIAAPTVAANSTTTYYATATDAAGNVSSCTGTGIVYTDDAINPPAPSGLATTPLSPANNNNPTITGMSEAGSTVNIYSNVGCTTFVASTTANGFGTFSQGVTVVDNTTTTYYVRAVDAANNQSACNAPGSSITYIEDSNAVDVPVLVSTTPASPSSSSTTPTVTGTTGAGFTIKIYTNPTCTSAVAATVVANAGGGFTTPAITVGANATTTFYATATNLSSNVSACSAGLAYTHDSVAPGAPMGLGFAPASPANNNTPTATGMAEAGSTVKLYTNAACSLPAGGAGSGVATGGAFSFAVSGGVIGDNTSTSFYATATDAAGNASACTAAAVTYVEDSNAPATPSITSSMPMSPSNMSTSPTLNGSAEANSTVKIYTTAGCTGAPVATGAATAGATFAIAASVSANTSTTFRATATDAAGNTSGCSAGFTYTHDNQAPAQPVITATNPVGPSNVNNVNVIGSAEAGSTVTLYTNATCTSATAGTGSAATFASPGVAATVAADSSTTFYAKATDAAGNVSACSSTSATYVEDSTAPATPSLTSTTPTSPSKTNTTPTINGSAENGATVNLYTAAACAGGITASGTASQLTGLFAIPVTVTANTSTTFYAKAVDAAGNASGCTAVGIGYTHDSVAPSPPTASLSPAGPANNNMPSYTGTTEPNATITIYTNAACSALVTSQSANASGMFTIPLSVSDNTTTTFYSTATDLAGNVSACTSTGAQYIEDSNSPTAPTVTGTTPTSPSKTSTSPTINGTSEANATIDVYTMSDCTGTRAGTGAANGAGAFAISVTVTANTTTTFYAKATDAAGNFSGCSTTFATYTHDNVPPGQVNGIASNPTSPGSSTTPTISGLGESGATIKVYLSANCSGAPVATLVAGGTPSTWSTPVTVGANVSTSITAIATDAAGNSGPCSAAFTYTHDSIAPATPAITGALPSSPSNVNTPAILGTAEAGSTVSIYTAAGCATGTPTTGVATGGNFAINVSVSDNSVTSFYAKTTDPAGNSSGCTAAAFTYTEDSIAPGTPTITSNPTSPSTQNSPTISGNTSESGATVKLYSSSNCSSGTLGSATSGSGGAYSINITFGSDTSNTIYAQASDPAGNFSACSAGFTYVEDSTAPAVPTGLSTQPGSPANDNNPKITGTAENNATIKVFTTAGCSGASVATGTSTGTFTFSLPMVADNSTTYYYVQASDAAGNTSACSAAVQYVEDSIANAPVITATNPTSPTNASATPTVIGTGEPNATVYLYRAAACSTVIGTGTITGAGNWSIPGVSLATNTTTPLYAKIIDQANNTSACTTTAFNFTHDDIAPVFVGTPTAVPNGVQKIHVAWSTATETGTPPVYYQICKGQSPGACNTFSVDATTGTGATSYDLTGLVAGNRLWIRVRAVDGAGNPSAASPEVSAAVWGPGNSIQVSAGYNFSCALYADGTVWCWGGNNNGQLGNGSIGGSSTAAVQVVGLSDVVNISANGTTLTNDGHACAVKTDGKVYCWGSGYYGELGNNSSTDTGTPVQVTGITNAVSVGVGGVHSCAVLSNGQVKCWGLGAQGELGNGSSSNSATPVLVSGISTAVEVSAGVRHTCARLANGTGQCWGDNTYGQLGNNSMTGTSSPVAVNTFGGSVWMKKIDLGEYHSCAVSNDGRAYCWGYNANGQIGNNTTTQALVPTIVLNSGSNLTQVYGIAAGGYSSCASRATGGVYCWGANPVGQLGTGNTTEQHMATAVSGALNIGSNIAMSDSHTCSLRTNGKLMCWGDGGSGQLGNESTSSSTSAIVATAPVGVEGVSKVVAGQDGACEKLSNGEIACWGYNGTGQIGDNTLVDSAYPFHHVLDNAIVSIKNARDVARGASHACAIKGDGSVECWGYNYYGELGNGTTTDSKTSVVVTGVTGAVQIATGGYHSCALIHDGSVKCWGSGTSGQLGNHASTDSSTAVTVQNTSFGTLTGIVSISAAGPLTCGVHGNGNVYCWGYGNYGANGDNDSNNADVAHLVIATAPSTALVNAIEVDANEYGACAITHAAVRCWGYGGFGEMGNNTFTTTNAVAQTATTSGDFVHLSGGYGHVCGIKANAVYCWGYNGNYQLGDGLTANRSVPYSIGLASTAYLGVGAYHSCSGYADGTAACWGYGAYGANGDGDASGHNTTVPTDVLYSP